jgi:hypothetical protein
VKEGDLVGWAQIVSGAVLVAVLLLLSGYYAWRQAQTLRRLRASVVPLDAEEQFELRQARRRLVGCVLLLVLGVQLLGALLFLEAPAQHLADARDADPDSALTPAERVFMRIYGGYWIVFLLLLLALVAVAACELWTVRQHGLRLRRQLLADRRAELERDVRRRGQSRNGPP